MSVFVKCFDCLTRVDIPTALKSVMRQDDDGSIYINIKFNEKEQCDDYSLAYGCLGTTTMEDMIQSLIVEDDCGNCSINVIANICDECGFIVRQ